MLGELLASISLSFREVKNEAVTGGRNTDLVVRGDG